MEAAPASRGSGGIGVRYRILGLLFVLSFVNYLLRNNMSVALPGIRAEFGYTTAQLGWILGAFNVTYALFQVPGGVFGEVCGPRRALALAALAWGVLGVLTGVVPGLLTGTAAGAMAALVVIRLLTGIANAPVFPIAAGAIANWFPRAGWAFPNAALSSGLTLGQAAVGPLASMLIVAFGWRAAFYLLAPLGIAAGAWWWWYARDYPHEHRAVSQEEVALVETGRAPPEHSRTAWRAVLRNRDVLLLSVSYFSVNYTFFMFAQWLITYLVEERGFTLLEGGLVSALPFIVGAVLAAVGGVVCDRLSRRIGLRWGCRLPGIVGLLMVAWLLLAGAGAPNPMLAVVLLSLCFGFTQFTEGAYWQATTAAAGPHTATASGVLNMGGNLAGFLAPAVGLMVDRLGWWPALATGSAFALLGAALWFFIDGEPRGSTPVGSSTSGGRRVEPFVGASG
jgi:ACS family glucarate transporter-like MFS transporter